MPGTLIRPADRFARMLEHTLGRDLYQPFFGDEVSTRTWMPPVDIRETEEALVVYAEVPGLDKGDIRITLENNLLTLSGERKFDTEVKENEWHRIERAYGSFSRSFRLPTNVASDRVSAVFKNGILEITVPKADEAKPRQIEIQ